MRIIGGEFSGRKLFIPSNVTTRPTADLVKASLFNILQSCIRGSVVLDLFAGSGSLGLEALSRGAKCVHFVEKDKQCFQILKKNCDFISGDKALYNVDFISALEKMQNLSVKFDIVFLDPPYDSGFELQAIKFLDKFNLLSEKSIVVIEQDFNVEQDFIGFNNYNLYDTRKYGRKKLYFLKYEVKK